MHRKSPVSRVQELPLLKAFRWNVRRLQTLIAKLATTELSYWEIVADKLSAAGWSSGYCSAVTRNGWRWIVDAHREGRRYIVHSDELPTAFLELEETLL
jgi:hypothetical protein